MNTAPAKAETGQRRKIRKDTQEYRDTQRFVDYWQANFTRCSAHSMRSRSMRHQED